MEKIGIAFIKFLKIIAYFFKMHCILPSFAQTKNHAVQYGVQCLGVQDNSIFKCWYSFNLICWV